MIIGHIYYGVGLFILLFHVTALIHFKSISNLIQWNRKFKKVTNNSPSISDYRTNGDYELNKFVKIFNLLTNMWIVFGLLTSSWAIFVCMIFMRSLLFLIRSNLFHKYLFFVFNFMNASLLFFLIINHFHLHINLFQIIIERYF